MVEPRLLIVAADDLGLHPSYDRGILDAAHAGAIDAVGVMVRRSPRADDLAVLAELGIALGLHLEPEGGEELPGGRRSCGSSRRSSCWPGRPPDHLDGHHHCHAVPGVAARWRRSRPGSIYRSDRSRPSIAATCGRRPA